MPPASHIDITPTIMDYMGLPLPKSLEGKSMMPQLLNSEIVINEFVFTEFTRYEADHDGFGGLQMMRAATNGHVKLVLNLMDMDEFYDLDSDPAEIHNLIDDPNWVLQRNHVHDVILKHMNDTRDLYRGYQWACRSWRPDKKPSWVNDGYTRQRENEEYEPRQLDYDTGVEMVEATRYKLVMDEKK